jgi:hypothetical protein
VGVSVEVEELVMLVEADEGVLEDGKTVEEVLEEGVTIEEVLGKDESGTEDLVDEEDLFLVEEEDLVVVVVGVVVVEDRVVVVGEVKVEGAVVGVEGEGGEEILMRGFSLSLGAGRRGERGLGDLE